jgi:hypothetical protein
MATDRLGVIGWLFVVILVSGVCMIFAGKFLHMPLAIVHKLLSVLCLVLLLRSAGTLRAIQAPPVLPAAIVVFVLAYLASFVTGAIQSIPACANSVWLNLHRTAAVMAAIACAVAARFIAIAVRS